MITELHPERGLALASGIALLIFGGVWLLVAIPVLRGVATGLRTGDWWSPFVVNERGGYGLLANSRFHALHRAPEVAHRTTRGLAARWLFWAVVLVGLGYYPATLAVTFCRSVLAG